MKFSVIIPIYKVEKYMRECVDSLLSQTYTDFELILVDDGSPDRCGEICDEYQRKDPRVIVIHKENGGLSDARNRGVQIARGEYIVFVDSDDYISTTLFLEKMNRAADQNPDIILYKNKKYYESRNEFVDEGFTLPDIDSQDSKGDVLTKLVASDSFYCAAWLKAVKRTLLTENGIEFKKGIVSEDQEWYYHVIEHAQTFAALDEAFIVYRQREGSITASFGDKNMADTLAVLKYWSQRISDFDMPEKERFALMSSVGKLYANLAIAYSTLSREMQRKYSRQMRELSFLLNYDLNPRTKKVKLVKTVVGFSGMICALSLANKVKRR